VAFVVFLMVRPINRLRRAEAAKPDPAPLALTPSEILLTEIRDALRKRPQA
jgi:large conductance mechanosensitive channel